jgi:hypothetical protein
MEHLRITLGQLGADELRLHYYFNGEAPEVACALRARDAEELFQRAEADYYLRPLNDPAQYAERLRSLGMDLYKFLDTSGCRLSRYIDQISGRWDVLVLSLAASGDTRRWPGTGTTDRSVQFLELRFSRTGRGATSPAAGRRRMAAWSSANSRVRRRQPRHSGASRPRRRGSSPAGDRGDWLAEPVTIGPATGPTAVSHQLAGLPR